MSERIPSKRLQVFHKCISFLLRKLRSNNTVRQLSRVGFGAFERMSEVAVSGFAGVKACVGTTGTTLRLGKSPIDWIELPTPNAECLRPHMLRGEHVLQGRDRAVVQIGRSSPHAVE